MHQARGPQAAILPFVKPVQRSVPFAVYGLNVRIVGPTETAPAEGAYIAAEAENGKGYYFLTPVTPSRD